MRWSRDAPAGAKVDMFMGEDGVLGFSSGPIRHAGARGGLMRCPCALRRCLSCLIRASLGSRATASWYRQDSLIFTFMAERTRRGQSRTKRLLYPDGQPLRKVSY